LELNNCAAKHGVLRSSFKDQKIISNMFVVPIRWISYPTNQSNGPDDALASKKLTSCERALNSFELMGRPINSVPGKYVPPLLTLLIVHLGYCLYEQ
jgi:hypothetical protein